MRTKHLLTKMMLLVAVMLMGAGAAWAQEVTIASFTASDENHQGWTISNATYASAGNGYYQLISSDASIVTPEIVWSDYSDITITISARKYGGPNATQGKISVSQGENELASYSPSGTSIVASSALSISPVDGKITISCPGASSSKGCGVQSIVIKGKEKASESPLASITLGGTYPTTFTEGDAFSAEGMTVTATYEDNSTKDVTSKATFFGYDMATTGSQEVTVSYTEGEVTKTATYNITVNAIPTHNVTWSVNGTITTESYKEGAAITFPENPADVEGKTFVGWTASAITGVIDEAPTFVTSATMGTEALTFYAVFAELIPGTQTDITDVLTSAITGVTGTNSYKDWSGKTVTSDAVYAGNTAVAGGTGAIQMRSNTGSGIISTISGGTLKSVTVTWSGDQDRTLDIYGSNTAYEAASDLYDSKKQGTKLGSIVKGTSTSLTVTGDYAYVGLRSNNGAMYLVDISIEWTAGTPDTYSAYCTTVAADNREEAGISFAEAAVTAEIVDNYTGQALNNPKNVSPIAWTSSNEKVATVEDGTVTVLAVGETTIKASFAGDENYKKAEVSYTLTVQDSRQAIDLSFAEASVTVNITETVAAPTLNGNLGDGVVSYESSNTDIATVDATGVVTGVAVGTATITATVAATNQYFGGTATFTVKVIDPNANDGSSVEKAYTVAEAIDVIKALPDNNATTEKYYIKGIVSSFQNTSIVGDGTNYRYFISDDGTTATQLQVYKGKGLNEATFTKADDLLVGDEVVIYGPIQYYNGKTPEIADGNYLVSLTRPVVASIDVNTNSIEAPAAGIDGTITVTYNNITTVAAEVKFYESDGTTETTYDWIDAEINNENNVYYLIGANDGEARTAYMKVYALDDENKDVYSELITITQAKYVAPETAASVTFDLGTNIFGLPEGSSNKTVTATDYTYGDYTINIAGSTGEGYYWHTTGYLIMGKKGASLTFPAFDFNVSKIKVYGRNGASGSVTFNVFVGDEAVSTEATSSLVDHEFVITDDKQAAGTVYTFKITGNANAQITKIEVFGYVSATVTDAGYATYCSKNALDFSTVKGLTAYKATISGKKVSFTPVTEVPASKGVLLKGAEATYNIPVIASTTADFSDNVFIGVTEETVVNEKGIYVLMNPTGGKGVGFYQTTGNSFTVKANSAYLPALAGDASRTFIGLDDVTSVKGITAETMANGEVYNLQGQRVSSQFTVHNSQLKKGLYIMNGKKVLVK